MIQRLTRRPNLGADGGFIRLKHIISLISNVYTVFTQLRVYKVDFFHLVVWCFFAGAGRHARIFFQFGLV